FDRGLEIHRADYSAGGAALQRADCPRAQPGVVLRLRQNRGESVMKGLHLMVFMLVAAAVVTVAGGNAWAVGECRAQSLGVPGPAYVFFEVGSTQLDAQAKPDIKERADP